MHRKYRLLGVMLAAFLLFSGVHGWQSSNRASVSIHLNDPYAAQGLLPDKTAFFPSSMISEDILQQAIASLDWQNPPTTEALSNSLTLRPMKANEQTVSTVYQLSLDLNAIPGTNGQANTLLDAICAQIRLYFETHLPLHQTFLSAQVSDANENGHHPTEPYLYLDTLELRARQLSRYLDELLARGGFFDVQGDNSAHVARFAAMKSTLNGMTAYDLPMVKALVTENGVAQDAAWLAQLLTCQNQRRNAAIQQKMNVYTANQNGIVQYGAYLPSSALIPTMDEAGAYTLSRTETAIDDLANAAEEALEEATTLQQLVTETETMLERLENPDEAAATVEEVASLLAQLTAQLDTISQELCTIEQEEAAIWSKNAIIFEQQPISLTDRIAWKQTLAETGGCLLFAAFCMRLWDKRKARKGATHHDQI